MHANEILGSLYVSEGSTLGGQVIRKALRRNSAIPKFHNFAFFTGYGERTGELCRRFIRALDELTEDAPEAQQAAIAGARKTFGYFIVLSGEAVIERV